MNWESLSEFIAMGGYGGYVWGSYGITALVIIAEMLLVKHRRRTARGQLPDASRAQTGS